MPRTIRIRQNPVTARSGNLDANGNGPLHWTRYCPVTAILTAPPRPALAGRGFGQGTSYRRARFHCIQDPVPMMTEPITDTADCQVLCGIVATAMP